MIWQCVKPFRSDLNDSEAIERKSARLVLGCPNTLCFVGPGRSREALHHSMMISARPSIVPPVPGHMMDDS
jgi:hypothetical protein